MRSSGCSIIVYRISIFKKKLIFKVLLFPIELSHNTDYVLIVSQENEVLRKQNEKLSEENGKLVGHKNHKQRIEYLVKLKKDNTRLQEVNFLVVLWH